MTRLWDDHAVMVGHASDRDDWLDVRQTGIGASEVASVLGVGFRAPAEIWAEKTGRIAPDDLSEVERIEWGIRLEPMIIEAYSEPRYAGRMVQRGGELLRSTVYPWALATLDAVTLHPEHGPIPLEIKTASAFVAREWQDGPPEPYYLQIQAQMLVTGARWASVACLIGGQQLVWCDVQRDEAAIERVVLVCSRFWEHVEANRVLEPDSTEEWARIFGQVMPEVAGSITALTDADRTLVDEYVAANANLKVAEIRQQTAKNILLARIGDAEEARFPDGSGFTYRSQTRGGSKFRVLRESAAPKKTTRRTA